MNIVNKIQCFIDFQTHTKLNPGYAIVSGCLIHHQMGVSTNDVSYYINLLVRIVHIICSHPILFLSLTHPDWAYA